MDILRELQSLIDPGAGDDETVYCRKSDIARWHDKIENIKLLATTGNLTTIGYENALAEIREIINAR